jgi:serine/threonine-protein kinase
MRHGPPPASLIVPGVSPALDDLITRALRCAPNDRPRDASALAAELAALQSSRSPGAPEGGDGEPTALHKSSETYRQRRHPAAPPPTSGTSADREATAVFTRPTTRTRPRGAATAPNASAPPTASQAASPPANQTTSQTPPPATIPATPKVPQPRLDTSNEPTSIFEMPRQPEREPQRANEPPQAAVTTPRLASASASPSASEPVPMSAPARASSSGPVAIPVAATVAASQEAPPEPSGSSSSGASVPWRYVSPTKGGLLEPKAANSQSSNSGPVPIPRDNSRGGQPTGHGKAKP